MIKDGLHFFTQEFIKNVDEMVDLHKQHNEYDLDPDLLIEFKTFCLECQRVACEEIETGNSLENFILSSDSFKEQVIKLFNSTRKRMVIILPELTLGLAADFLSILAEFAFTNKETKHFIYFSRCEQSLFPILKKLMVFRNIMLKRHQAYLPTAGEFCLFFSDNSHLVIGMNKAGLFKDNSGNFLGYIPPKDSPLIGEIGTLELTMEKNRKSYLGEPKLPFIKIVNQPDPHDSTSPKIQSKAEIIASPKPLEEKIDPKPDPLAEIVQVFNNPVTIERGGEMLRIIRRLPVNLLLEALGRVGEKGRDTIYDILAERGEQILPEIINSFHNPSFYIRERCCIILKKMRQNQFVPTLAIPSLLAALKDESWGVRREATTALGVIANPSTYGEVERMTSDSEYQVRERAVYALKWYNNLASIPVLTRCENDCNDEVRKAAHTILHDIRLASGNWDSEIISDIKCHILDSVRYQTEQTDGFVSIYDIFKHYNIEYDAESVHKITTMLEIVIHTIHEDIKASNQKQYDILLKLKLDCEAIIRDLTDGTFEKQCRRRLKQEMASIKQEYNRSKKEQEAIEKRLQKAKSWRKKYKLEDNDGDDEDDDANNDPIDLGMWRST